MKIEIAEGELTQLAELTVDGDLRGDVHQLLHAIWLDGFYEGNIDTARKLQALIGQAASQIFLSGQDDELARRLRALYDRAQTMVDTIKVEREANRPKYVTAGNRIRDLFRAMRKIIINWERG